jgi:hypothetical protein
LNGLIAATSIASICSVLLAPAQHLYSGWNLPAQPTRDNGRNLINEKPPCPVTKIWHQI